MGNFHCITNRLNVTCSMSRLRSENGRHAWIEQVTYWKIQYNNITLHYVTTEIDLIQNIWYNLAPFIALSNSHYLLTSPTYPPNTSFPRPQLPAPLLLPRSFTPLPPKSNEKYFKRCTPIQEMLDNLCFLNIKYYKEYCRYIYLIKLILYEIFIIITQGFIYGLNSTNQNSKVTIL